MIITLKIVGLLLMFFVGFVFLIGLLETYKEDKEKVLELPFLALTWIIACFTLMAIPVIYTINKTVQAFMN